MQNFDHQTLELVVLVLVAVAMLVQALVLLAAFLAMRKAAQSMNEKIEAFRASVTPIIESATPIFVTSRDLITKLAPKIESASEDLVSITHTIRVQAADLQVATNEMVERARGQANRIDSTLTSFFDAMDRAGSFVADCVSKPMRQLGAVIASAKAVIESLRASSPASRAPSNHVPGDSDMFV
jgi:hypothetical protein